MATAPAGPRADLDPADFRRMLDEERSRLLDEIRRMEDINVTGGEQGERSEISHVDQHPADQGTEVFLRERDQGLRENYRDELDQVDRALGKLENGGYGYCDKCGTEILKERLEVLPWTPYCIDCSADVASRF